MSRSFVNFFDGAPDYRGFDEADDSFFRPSAHSTTRRVPYVGYEYVDSGFSRALAHAAGCHSSPSSHGQIPDLNSPLAFSNSRSGMISHNEIPINVVSVPTITSRDPISSTPAGKNSRIRSHLHEKAATRAPYFWRKIPIESAAPRSILQPPASVIPIDNAKPLKILNNNQSLEQRQLQLEAEIEAQWHEREALKSKMHAVKVRYNAGNARLAILAEKSMVPGCSGEAKVMLRKEFDMITVQCLKYQKEFFEMQRQIAELRTPTPVEAGISREQTPYHIPKDLLTKYEFVDAKLAAKTSLQDYTITSRSRPYGFSGNEITQVPTASSVQVVKQKNTKVSPFEAHFGRPSFCFSAKDLIAMRAANSESQSSTGYSLGNAEGTSSYHLMPMCPRALGSNRTDVIKSGPPTNKVVREEGEIIAATEAKRPIADLSATIESVPNTPLITAVHTGPGVLDSLESIEALDISKPAEEVGEKKGVLKEDFALKDDGALEENGVWEEDGVLVRSTSGSEDEWEKL